MLRPGEAAAWLRRRRALATVGLLGFIVPTHAQQPSAGTNQVQVAAIQGTVEVARAGQAVWDLASTQQPYCRLHPGDQIRTKDRSRAMVRLSDLTVVELGPKGHFELLPLAERKAGIGVFRGLLYLFHRDKPGEFYFRTPTASPVIRGTEFNLEVAEDGATALHLLEGQVALTNDLGQLELRSGEAGMVQSARPPRRMAALEAVNVIQWTLYYPAVLDLEELRLSAEEQKALADSLAAYRRGDLLAALGAYPAARQPASDAERVYLAALLLGVGEVSNAEGLLSSLSGSDERSIRLAAALRTLVAAVKFQPMPPEAKAPGSPRLASTLLAESYYHQSRFELEAALSAARSAVEQAPGFAFGWARVAELEFSFGRTRRALDAVDRALKLAPRHAPALAVKGFLLAAQNRIGSALAQFDEAIAADAALGNAWLGRGLGHIRQGNARQGAADLLVAAALEPNRALLRSYLGKAFSQSGDDGRALRELERARQLDPHDPTAWLYSALLNQQRNRINDAIRDLERSQDLNDNRQLYRSRLLLDEDRAVRQANLAGMYQDAGSFEQSVREAARAVSSDYANYSAHLFLANSYAQLRDLDPINLRYETVTLSEYLVAQLLSPVGGSALSPYVSQQDYSRLFERQGFGISSATEYLSQGDWRQRGVQYGTFANGDYALDAYYATQNGQRPNNDFDLLSLSAAARVQVSPQDTVFVQAVRTEFESGDLRQFYEFYAPTNFHPGLRIKELQEPNLFAGYHHQWGPGSHTLALFSWLNDDFRLSDTNIFVPTLRRDEQGIFGRLADVFSAFGDRQEAVFTAYSAELQQIWQTANNTLVVGGRYQDGDTESDVTLAKTPPSFGTYPPGGQHVETELRRGVVYAYDHWNVVEPLWLIGGVSYDWLSFPENIDVPPVNDRQTEKDRVSPKAGVVWLPTKDMVLRGAYTRSLGGLYYDNSARLEPTHVAGFNQAFRSLIPEYIAGIAPGAEFETADLDFSWRLPTGTYLGVGGEWLWSDADREIGVFDSSTTAFPQISASNTLQRLEFEERSLTANINQLIGRDWSLGVRYRVSEAELRQRLVQVLSDLRSGSLPPSRVPESIQDDWALLHQLILQVNYSHPCGFFAQAQALWYAQDNRNHPDEDFWQFNVFAGYRFARRRVELLVGGLNLTDQDYRLNPINLYAELPRERTLVVSGKFNF
jgi:tetratricopeptide (TPR) repeat protein